jgi:hypothetical protein
MKTLADSNAAQAVRPEHSTIVVYPLREGAYRIEPRTGQGDHHGGDPLMLLDLFAPRSTPDPLARAADERAGAYSILVGVAANLSMASDKPVRIAELVKNLERPTYPKMSARGAAVPMPAKIPPPAKG